MLYGEIGRPTVMSPHGMVAAAHPLAAQAGVTVLQKGGNAVDAAIATNAVLNVTQPHMCGLGGDLFALVYDAESQNLMALNGSGRSPHAANRGYFEGSGLDAIPTDGLIAADVPGCLDAWVELLDRCGTMPLASLLEPAIDYALNGFPVTHQLSVAIHSSAGRLNQFPTSASVMMPGGEVPRPGETLRQPDLAHTLRQLCEGGRDAFYQGPIAEEIVRFCQRNDGLLSLEDFRDHHSDWVDPISTTYRGYQIMEHPPNTQGYTFLLELNLIEGFELEALGHLTPDYLHLLIEAKKVAFADRDRYNTDPEWEHIPLEELLSKEYAAKRRSLIDPSNASEAVVHGDPTAGDTTYFCVVDAQGNAVSLIQSLFHGFGCGVIAGSTGLFIQNRMSYFSLDPSHANRLEPHKRTAHTLNPAMVLKDGRPVIVLGTMGGDGQTQTLMQLTSALLDFDLHPQAAMEIPRWRSDQGRELLMEGRFAEPSCAALEAKGHKIRRVGNWAHEMGHAHLIRMDSESRSGAADPRGDGAAIGY